MVFRHVFAPYLFHSSRNNRRDKLRSKFEAAEMMLGPWNQQYLALDTGKALSYTLSQLPRRTKFERFQVPGRM